MLLMPPVRVTSMVATSPLTLMVGVAMLSVTVSGSSSSWITTLAMRVFSSTCTPAVGFCRETISTLSPSAFAEYFGVRTRYFTCSSGAKVRVYSVPGNWFSSVTASSSAGSSWAGSSFSGCSWAGTSSSAGAPGRSETTPVNWLRPAFRGLFTLVSVGADASLTSSVASSSDFSAGSAAASSDGSVVTRPTTVSSTVMSAPPWS